MWETVQFTGDKKWKRIYGSKHRGGNIQETIYVQETIYGGYYMAEIIQETIFSYQYSGDNIQKKI